MRAAPRGAAGAAGPGRASPTLGAGSPASAPTRKNLAAGDVSPTPPVPAAAAADDPAGALSGNPPSSTPRSAAEPVKAAVAAVGPDQALGAAAAEPVTHCTTPLAHPPHTADGEQPPAAAREEMSDGPLASAEQSSGQSELQGQAPAVALGGGGAPYAAALLRRRGEHPCALLTPAAKTGAGTVARTAAHRAPPGAEDEPASTAVGQLPGDVVPEAAGVCPPGGAPASSEEQGAAATEQPAHEDACDRSARAPAAPAAAQGKGKEHKKQHAARNRKRQRRAEKRVLHLLRSGGPLHPHHAQALRRLHKKRLADAVGMVELEVPGHRLVVGSRGIGARAPPAQVTPAPVACALSPTEGGSMRGAARLHRRLKLKRRRATATRRVIATRGAAARRRPAVRPPPAPSWQVELRARDRETQEALRDARRGAAQAVQPSLGRVAPACPEDGGGAAVFAPSGDGSDGPGPLHPQLVAEGACVSPPRRCVQFAEDPAPRTEAGADTGWDDEDGEDFDDEDEDVIPPEPVGAGPKAKPAQKKPAAPDADKKRGTSAKQAPGKRSQSQAQQQKQQAPRGRSTAPAGPALAAPSSTLLPPKPSKKNAGVCVDVKSRVATFKFETRLWLPCAQWLLTGEQCPRHEQCQLDHADPADEDPQQLKEMLKVAALQILFKPKHKQLPPVPQSFKVAWGRALPYLFAADASEVNAADLARQVQWELEEIDQHRVDVYGARVEAEVLSVSKAFFMVCVSAAAAVVRTAVRLERGKASSESVDDPATRARRLELLICQEPECFFACSSTTPAEMIDHAGEVHGEAVRARVACEVRPSNVSFPSLPGWCSFAAVLGAITTTTKPGAWSREEGSLSVAAMERRRVVASYVKNAAVTIFSTPPSGVPQPKPLDVEEGVHRARIATTLARAFAPGARSMGQAFRELLELFPEFVRLVPRVHVGGECECPAPPEEDVMEQRHEYIRIARGSKGVSAAQRATVPLTAKGRCSRCGKDAESRVFIDQSPCFVGLHGVAFPVPSRAKHEPKRLTINADNGQILRALALIFHHDEHFVAWFPEATELPAEEPDAESTLVAAVLVATGEEASTKWSAQNIIAERYGALRQSVDLTTDGTRPLGTFTALSASEHAAYYGPQASRPRTAPAAAAVAAETATGTWPPTVDDDETRMLNSKLPGWQNFAAEAQGVVRAMLEVMRATALKERDSLVQVQRANAAQNKAAITLEGIKKERARLQEEKAAAQRELQESEDALKQQQRVTAEQEAAAAAARAQVNTALAVQKALKEESERVREQYSKATVQGAELRFQLDAKNKEAEAAAKREEELHQRVQQADASATAAARKAAEEASAARKAAEKAVEDVTTRLAEADKAVEAEKTRSAAATAKQVEAELDLKREQEKFKVEQRKAERARDSMKQSEQRKRLAAARGSDLAKRDREVRDRHATSTAAARREVEMFGLNADRSLTPAAREDAVTTAAPTAADVARALATEADPFERSASRKGHRSESATTRGTADQPEEAGANDTVNEFQRAMAQNMTAMSRKQLETAKAAEDVQDAAVPAQPAGSGRRSQAARRTTRTRTPGAPAPVSGGAVSEPYEADATAPPEPVGCGSTADRRPKASWIIVPIIGAARRAVPWIGMAHVAVRELGVANFCAAVAAVRATLDSQPYLIGDGDIGADGYIQAPVQERVWLQVQEAATRNLHAAAVETVDRLAGQPAPPPTDETPVGAGRLTTGAVVSIFGRPQCRFTVAYVSSDARYVNLADDLRTMDEAYEGVPVWACVPPAPHPGEPSHVAPSVAEFRRRLAPLCGMGRFAARVDVRVPGVRQRLGLPEGLAYDDGPRPIAPVNELTSRSHSLQLAVAYRNQHGVPVLADRVTMSLDELRAILVNPSAPEDGAAFALADMVSGDAPDICSVWGTSAAASREPSANAAAASDDVGSDTPADAPTPPAASTQSDSDGSGSSDDDGHAVLDGAHSAALLSPMQPGGAPGVARQPPEAPATVIELAALPRPFTAHALASTAGFACVCRDRAVQGRHNRSCARSMTFWEACRVAQRPRGGRGGHAATADALERYNEIRAAVSREGLEAVRARYGGPLPDGTPSDARGHIHPGQGVSSGHNEPPVAAQSPRAAAPQDRGAASEPDPGPQSVADQLPSLEDIVRINVSCLRNVPRRARAATDKALSAVLNNVATYGGLIDWQRYCLFARLVLRKPQPCEGELARIVADRARRFTSDNFRHVGTMWNEFLELRARRRGAAPRTDESTPPARAATPPPAEEAASEQAACAAADVAGHDTDGGDAGHNGASDDDDNAETGSTSAENEVGSTSREPAVLPPTARPGAHIMYDEVLDEDQFDTKRMKSVLFHAHNCEFSKAMSALSAVDTAKKTPENADRLRALHPTEPPPPARAAPPTAGAPGFSVRKVRGALRSFKLASSGGLSLLTPQHLKDCCGVPGTMTLSALQGAALAAAGGLVNEGARPVVYGARLVGLVKKNGSLRPVASGDVIRRLAGRLLSKSVAHDARKYFLARKQVGVAVEGGADAAIVACRDVARTLPEGHCIFKVDQRNAFNCANRAAMLDLIARDFPTLYPYARAAYGAHTWLYFGEHRIDSQSGVQQGCPLGPLFFSVVMAEARHAALVLMRERDSSLAELDFEAWFLDDGTVAGPVDAVIAYVRALEETCARFSLQFNRAKCEVICREGEALPDFFADVTHFTTADFELLGVPCGDDASVTTACDALARKVEQRLGRVAQLSDPQVVFSLLRHCGGFPLGNFLARASGPLGNAAFDDIDKATLAAFQAGVTDIADPVAREALRLPAGRGGMGLRSIRDSAPLAFIGATVAARALRHHLVTRACAARIEANPDPRVTAAMAAPEVAETEPVRALAQDLLVDNVPREGEKRAVKQQRELQGLRDAAVSDDVLARALQQPNGEQLVMRLRSASTKHASAWLGPLPGTDDPIWIDAPVFVSLVRYRYGCQLQPEPSPCLMCRTPGDVNDVYGTHTTKCKGGKYYVHNILRDTIISLSAEALLSPAVEPTNALTTTTERPDVMMRLTAGAIPTYVCLDVTVVSAETAARRATAIRENGGAARLAQNEKHAKYGLRAREEGFGFLGVAFDSFGGTSPDATTLMKRVGIAYGRRLNLSGSRAIPMVASVIMTTLMSAIGRLLLRNSAPTARARDYVALTSGTTLLDETAEPNATTPSTPAVGRVPNRAGGFTPAGLPLPTSAALEPRVMPYSATLAAAAGAGAVGDSGGASQGPSQDPDEAPAGAHAPQTTTGSADAASTSVPAVRRERDGPDASAQPTTRAAAAHLSRGATNLPAHRAGVVEPQLDLALPAASARAQLGAAPTVAPLAHVDGQVPDPYAPPPQTHGRIATNNDATSGARAAAAAAARTGGHATNANPRLHPQQYRADRTAALQHPPRSRGGNAGAARAEGQQQQRHGHGQQHPQQGQQGQRWLPGARYAAAATTAAPATTLPSAPPSAFAAVGVREAATGFARSGGPHHRSHLGQQMSQLGRAVSASRDDEATARLDARAQAPPPTTRPPQTRDTATAVARDAGAPPAPSTCTAAARSSDPEATRPDAPAWTVRRTFAAVVAAAVDGHTAASDGAAAVAPRHNAAAPAPPLSTAASEEPGVHSNADRRSNRQPQPQQQPNQDRRQQQQQQQRPAGPRHHLSPLQPTPSPTQQLRQQQQQQPPHTAGSSDGASARDHRHPRSTPTGAASGPAAAAGATPQQQSPAAPAAARSAGSAPRVGVDSPPLPQQQRSSGTESPPVVHPQRRASSSAAPPGRL